MSWIEDALGIDASALDTWAQESIPLYTEASDLFNALGLGGEGATSGLPAEAWPPGYNPGGSTGGIIGGSMDGDFGVTTTQGGELSAGEAWGGSATVAALRLLRRQRAAEIAALKDMHLWKYRRLNPLNPRALRRSQRRLDGFERFVRRSFTFRNKTMHPKSPFKMRRRKRG